MASVSQHQQSAFANPSNGDTLDATIVKGNDNTLAATYNAHDADATIHIQSDTGLPAAGTTGRLFLTTADRRLSYDNGSTWQALTLDAANVTSGTIATARIAGSYTGITGLGTIAVGEWNATPIGINKGGTGNTTAPTDGQLLIGSTAGQTFTLGTLTAGSNITITNAAGAITIAATGSAGTVTGPASSTANAIARFNGTAGTALKNSGVTISDADVVALPALLDLSAAGAGQIKFPATQNASADANTLDDYEEGTFTPAALGGITLSNVVGRYTKIGRVVHIHGQATWPSTSSPQLARLTSLPFTASASCGAAITLYSSYGTTSVVGIIPASAAYIDIYSRATQLDNTEMSTHQVVFSGSYIV